MIVNTNKIKILINKSESSLMIFFQIDIHSKFNWSYSVEKGINGGWKAYHGLENNCPLSIELKGTSLSNSLRLKHL